MNGKANLDDAVILETNIETGENGHSYIHRWSLLGFIDACGDQLTVYLTQRDMPYTSFLFESRRLSRHETWPTAPISLHYILNRLSEWIGAKSHNTRLCLTGIRLCLQPIRDMLWWLSRETDGDQPINTNLTFSPELRMKKRPLSYRELYNSVHSKGLLSVKEIEINILPGAP